MEKHHRHIVVLILLAFLISTACGIGSSTVSTIPGSPETAAAKTWSAMVTSAFLSTTATFTPFPYTDTPSASATPTLTNTPTPTNTLIPVLTQLPTHTPSMTPTRTLVPTVTRIVSSGSGGGGSGGGGGGGGGGGTSKPCLSADLVMDVTIPDGQIMPPATSFKKIWKIKNTGSCTWPRGSYMVPTKSNAWVGEAIKNNNSVKPGKNADYTVTLVSPNISPGGMVVFSGDWLLRLDNNTKLEPRNEDAFRVRIQVMESIPGMILWDYVFNYCSAKWEGRNDRILACPTSKDNANGFVRGVSPASLETLPAPVPAAIWSQPASDKDAEIVGTFPGMYIQTGDRFRASVGCLAGKEHCKVQVDLYYRVLGGDNVLINSIQEEYDGVTHNLVNNFDLTPFAGNYVTFILSVTALNDKEPAAAWYEVQLYRP